MRKRTGVQDCMERQREMPEKPPAIQDIPAEAPDIMEWSPAVLCKFLTHRMVPYKNNKLLF